MRTGFEAFLVKPVHQSLLYSVVTRIINGQPAFEPVEKPMAGYSADEIWPVDGALEALFPAKKVMKVLLAEDNLANQRLATIQLKKIGYEVDSVGTGTLAVKSVTLDPDLYQLVLMDCQMPEMDGFAATRLIREAEQQSGRHIPIVAMTANAMQGDREACVAAGMDDYMSKPIRLDDLKKVIERWTGGPVAEVGEIKAGSSGEDPARSLDPEIIRGIRDLQMEGEADFLTEMIDLYLADSRVVLERIRVSIDCRDCDELKRAAHMLKGTSGNLGARILASYCSEVESLAAKIDIDGAIGWMNRLEKEYKVVCKALKAERVTNSSQNS
jgi:CheY-like chemotaxis protein